MNRKYRKIFLTLLVFVVLIIGGVVLVNTDGVSIAEEGTKTETDVTKDSVKGDKSSVSAEEKAAENLIGETISRKKIKQDVGEWEKFEMNSNGCERGVYAGKFYYKDFTIFSRTYNKGKTFHVVSVN